MKWLHVSWMAGCLSASGWAADLKVESFDRFGLLSWTNAIIPGVNTIETAPSPAGPWSPQRNVFTTTSVSQVTVPVEADAEFIRLKAVGIAGTPEGHSNLIHTYGLLETIAGMGEYGENHRDNWEPQFAGGPATEANLSRPHITFADRGNNLYIVDEGSSLVLKVDTNGLIFPYAGAPNRRGFNGDGPDVATNLWMDRPNGGYMKEDGTIYVMDTYNGKIRRVSTDGMMETLFTTTAPIPEGRGLWVRDDESEVYFCTGSALNRWTPTGGVAVARSGFFDLGNIYGDEENGVLYITDRDAHSVYTWTFDDVLTRIAGNGTTVGGGDGAAATETGLNRPRTLAFLPNGGYLIGEHSPGFRIWYVDPNDRIHLWVRGASGAYAGDGDWFYDNLNTAKVGKVRALTLDRQGNVIMTVNDHGFIRRIRFLEF